MFELPSRFWLDNLHFITYAFSALGFFVSGWLNYDSYKEAQDTKLIGRFIGFFVLALWALLLASGLEIARSVYVLQGLEVIGIAALTLGFFIEPLPHIPDTMQKRGVTGSKPIKVAAFAAPLPAIGLNVVAAGLWLVLLIRTWIFSTTGLTKEYRGFAMALLFIFLARLTALLQLVIHSDSVLIFNLMRPYGAFWIIEHSLLLIGVKVENKIVITSF